MKLKYKVNSKDELAPGQLPFYTEHDGALVLDVDGAIDKTKLDEFQKEKISLLTQLDEVKKRYEGIDPDHSIIIQTLPWPNSTGQVALARKPHFSGITKMKIFNRLCLVIFKPSVMNTAKRTPATQSRSYE